MLGIDGLAGTLLSGFNSLTLGFSSSLDYMANLFGAVALTMRDFLGVGSGSGLTTGRSCFGGFRRYSYSGLVSRSSLIWANFIYFIGTSS